MSRLFAAGSCAFYGPLALILAACSPTSGNSVGSGPGTGGADGVPNPPTAVSGGGPTSGNTGSSASGALATNGNQLVNASGAPVTLHGVTWYGFDSNSVLPNTNQGTDRLSGDFATAIYRLQLLGLNTVRLPFAFATVLDTNSTLSSLNATCVVDSNSQIAAATADPALVGSPNVTLMPVMVAPPTFTPGACNTYIPYQSASQRFAYAVTLLADNGFYVVLADRENSAALYDSNTLGTQWTTLLQAILAGAGNPNVLSHVILDLVDEPDRVGLTWTNLTPIYTNAMATINAAHPSLLFFVEGGGQQAIGANPGDGFVTNSQTIATNSLSDANPFFIALSTASYRSQVVLAPHIYPPSVSSNTSDTGTTLWTRLNSSFGAYNFTGYTIGSQAYLYPVVVGGFGSGFSGNTDLQMMIDLSGYLTLSEAAANSGHAAISSWIWLDYYQTGAGSAGLVSNTDWKTVQWKQIEYLQGINPTGQTPAFSYDLGLVPWY